MIHDPIFWKHVAIVFLLICAFYMFIYGTRKACNAPKEVYVMIENKVPAVKLIVKACSYMLALIVCILFWLMIFLL